MTKKTIATHQEPCGLTTIAADVFSALQNENQCCLWLDMNDIGCTDDLFEHLYDAVCYRAGIEDWMPLITSNDPSSRAELLNRVIKAGGRKWVIFLNARETPGGSLLENRPYDELQAYLATNPNGWWDEDVIANPQSNGNSLLVLLKELAGPLCPACTIVLLCRDEPAMEETQTAGTAVIEQKAPRFLERLKMAGDEYLSGFNVNTWVFLSKECLQFDDNLALEVAKEWNDVRHPVKQQFLFVLVLMQRTRLLATFFFFQDLLDELGITNSRRLNHELRDLEKRHLFRRKSGGHVWMHFRIRAKIRNDICSQNWELSLKTHKRLTEWYRSVFLSSRDPSAVFEVVYHTCQALACGLEGAEKPPLKDEHHSLLIKLLEDAETILRDAHDTILARSFSRGSCRRLWSLVARLEGLCLKTESRPLKDGIVRLEKRCVIVMREIAAEVGEYRVSFRRQQQLSEIIVEDKIETINQNEASAFFPVFSKEVKSAEDKSVTLLEWAQEDAPQDRPILPLGENYKPGFRQPAWLRWQWWIHTLSIQSRDYSRGEEVMLRSFASLLGHDDFRSEDWLKKTQLLGTDENENMKAAYKNFGAFLEAISTFLSKPSVALGGPCYNHDSLLLQAASFLERHLELLLLFDLLLWRVHGIGEVRLLETAKQCFNVATNLLERFEAQQRGLEPEVFPKLHRIYAHLLAHRSIVAVREGNTIKCPEESEISASSYLNQAQARLRSIDPGRNSISWAILDLHRAEVAIEHAVNLQLNSDHLQLKFSRFYEDIKKLAVGEQLDSASLDNCKPTSDQWQHVIAALGDAQAALCQAETILLSRRKNVWWATWYFQRRMKVMELELWASVFDKGRPIPYLGLASAPRRTETLADRILDDTLYMVRNDVYRLATVVEAYAGCALALHMRLQLDTTIERLPFRQREMQERLRHALSRLKLIRDPRNVNLQPPPDDDLLKIGSKGPHPKVRDYLDKVENESERILAVIAPHTLE